jgi:hypothetical protein
MSFEITQNAKNLKDQVNKTPQIILEIDGIDYKFSTGDVLRYPTFDEVPPLEFDDGIFFDTPIGDDKTFPYITLKDTSNDIRQQLIPEKGGSGGVQSFKIGIVNYNKTLNEVFNTELLGKECRVSLGFLGGVFPQDFILIFEGFIDSYSIKHGVYVLNIAHPDQLKRQELFNLINTKLTSAIDNLVLTIPVESTDEFIIPTIEQEENFISYIKIDDEIMRITANSPTDFTVLRNQLGSSVDSHDDEAEVGSFYRLIGDPIDLAMKLMLSGGDEFYASGVEVSRFVTNSENNDVPNSIYFDFDITYLWNVTEGDTVEISGATNGANNVTRIITEIVVNNSGSYILVDGLQLASEIITSATANFKCKYNTMPVGLGMKPRHVDIQGIESLIDLLGILPSIDIYIRDEIKVKEWIESELFKPCGLFFLPRKGRTSIYATLPPFNTGETFVLDENTITNITDIAVQRSTNRNFYNAIAYKFEDDAVTEKFKSGTIILNDESFTNIKVGYKQLVIEAKGFRENNQTRDAIQQRATKILDKYSSGPEFIDGVRVRYQDGYQIEIGDIIVFGSDNLQIPNGNLDYFKPTLFEVVDKKISISTGRIELNLINSGYGIIGRFPVISPASYIQAQQGSNTVILSDSQGLPITKLEVDKWQEFIGRKLKIRDINFTESQVLTLIEIGNGNQNALTFLENINVTIGTDYIVELPDYDDAESYHKASYGYFNPSVIITNVISSTIIECDVTNLFVGSTCEIHSPEWNNISQIVTIADITGNQVTFSEPLDYLPSINDVIDMVGFKSDEGNPYLYI